MNRDTARLAISTAIIAYFGWAVVIHWSAGIEQTVTNLAMIVVGYWLGSSKGSADKADALASRDSGPIGTPEDPVSVEPAP